MFNKRKGIETRTTTIVDRLAMFGKGLSNIMGFIKKKHNQYQDVLRHYSFPYTEIHPELLRTKFEIFVDGFKPARSVGINGILTNFRYKICCKNSLVLFITSIKIVFLFIGN
jgi:hypothetical protein